MAISSKARPYLLIVAVVLVVAGVVVARIPEKTGGSAGSTTSAPPSSAGALAGQGGDGAGDPYYATDGNTGYDVDRYDVAISYDPATKLLEGEATITAKATSDLTRFNLDLHALKVSEVRVGDQAAKFTQEGDHELVITPASELRANQPFTAVVTYAGEPQMFDDKALGTSGWQISASGGAFAAGEPHSATSWFPANDTPKDKAKFSLSARVPNGWSVVSNGREDGSSTANGWTTFKWTEDTPLATYLATVAIDKWQFDRSQLVDGTKVVNAYAPGAEGKRAQQNRLPEILAFLSEKFGPYPFDEAGGIYLADNIGFSLETQTRPIYAQWADLETVVHENAHQWFGDSVSLENWADICLNECFASYSQWLWAEAKEGANLDDRFRAEVEKRKDSTNYWSRKLYDMGRGNEFRGVYDKGILALHALRRQIGDPAFDQVLKGWTSQHKDGNASWPQFEEHVEKIAGQDLDGFFAAWFRGDQRPSDEYLLPGALRR
ncbi:M1 family metallopeptidase [Umezawaea endophytica]|uniref:Aminopeptidase N n=1 Tax=Umezawaea endophytica TaxID=1654476 RepID=A0A9X2VP11_9PSEU|nr:M1 family metallopeptidase [Umezawaea endophytica]MCS7478778.1 M1 family metallopeptidase [Umezawaea endophytica]